MKGTSDLMLKNWNNEELIRNFVEYNNHQAFTVLINRHKIMIRKIIYTVNCSTDNSNIDDIEQLPAKEVSRIMSIPVGTVKSKLHRSREKLSNIIRGRI